MFVAFKVITNHDYLSTKKNHDYLFQ